jgi:two-component system sensor histidine kinase GlrK
MRARLLEYEQQKNRFLQQISHELKTPLTALREGAQLLSDDVVGELNEEQREIAAILRHNSIELQRRIEDLLSYGWIQFHKLALEMAELNPREVLDSVVSSQKLALNAKGIVLNTRAANAAVRADREALRVILDNLLSNAIKYSPQGGSVSMDIHISDDSLAIDVVDAGPGICAEDIAHIFDPYYSGRVPGTGPIKGSGLGLSIVKEYASAHGGSIAVIAQPEARGAHFHVELALNGARA